MFCTRQDCKIDDVKEMAVHSMQASENIPKRTASDMLRTFVHHMKNIKFQRRQSALTDPERSVKELSMLLT